MAEETESDNSHGGKAAALLERCLRGEPEAWEKFIGEYHPVLEGSVRLAYWRTLYRIPEADVANVVQDLYARLFEDNFRRLRTYKGRCPLALWLRTLATHHALNVIRNEKSRGRFGGGDLDSMPLKSDRPQEGREEAEELDEIRHLKVLMDQLSPLQKTVLQMVYMDGRSYQDISRALGIPVPTVGSLISRARDRLRQLMTPRLSEREG